MGTAVFSLFSTARRSHTSRIVLAASVALLAIACGDGGNLAGDGGASTVTTDCRVRFAITEGELAGPLDVRVSYEGAPGHFSGAGREVECTRLDDRIAVFAGNNCHGTDGACRRGDPPMLAISVHTSRVLPAPIELAECRFVGDEPPPPETIRIESVSASTVFLDPVDPPPTVQVTSIDCDLVGDTTTTLPTEDPCAGAQCSADEACIDGSRVATDRYRIEFATETAATYGALQVRISHDCTAGSFEGTGRFVHCSVLPQHNAFASFNQCCCSDEYPAALLNAAIVSLPGWPGPGAFMACEYTSADGLPPKANAFTIEVEDASTQELKPISGVRVSVSGIRAIAPPASPAGTSP